MKQAILCHCLRPNCRTTGGYWWVNGSSKVKNGRLIVRHPPKCPSCGSPNWDKEGVWNPKKRKWVK